MSTEIRDLLIEIVVRCIGLAAGGAIISASAICTARALMWMFE